ncbi:MAG: DNA translocase FtsK [Sphaerochaetaceae bacterium]
MKKVALFLAAMGFIVSVLSLVPAVVPAHQWQNLPYSSSVTLAVDLVDQWAVPIQIDDTWRAFVLPIAGGLWLLFYLIFARKPFYWWLAPYCVGIYYTLYLFLQLLGKAQEPSVLLKRLAEHPSMAAVLLMLLLLIEIAIALLLLIASVRLSRWAAKRAAAKGRANKKVPKAKKKHPQKRKKEKEHIEVQSPVTDEEPLTLHVPSELPPLKTLQSDDDELYVGRIKEQDDHSIIVESSSAPFDPMPTLRRKMAEEEARPVIPMPKVILKPKAKKAQEEQKPLSPPIELVEKEEEDDDVDHISGVGGLVSASEGSDALLSRAKIRYNRPSEELLDTYPDHSTDIDEHTRAAGESLIQTLKQFKIEAQLLNIVKGPTVTMYEVSPAPGVRVSSITSLSDNIALQLAARQVRIVAPIPGKQAVGIEVPNRTRSIIGFKDLLPSVDAKTFQIPMVLGRKITGEPVVIELTQTPHLLIAGATGSGKSVCVNSLISTLLYRRSPKEVRLILVDPKIVELRVYNGIPHLLTPVITESKKTIKALEFCLYEMERRYNLLNGLAVRNISAYNKKVAELSLAREKLPYIVVVIDEFADLMATVGKELEMLLARLAAMARAVGIHLVLATQRPSANVITGIIKSNIPTRIAFMVASQIDSRIIIDETGAEKLLGRGDMLFAAGWDPHSIRIQGAFLSDEEVERIVAYAKTQGEPDYLDEAFFEDEEVEADDSEQLEGDTDEILYEKAKKIVIERQSASASYLQRRLKIGYNRAARLVEQMEEEGMVGPARGSKPRELLRIID